MSADETGWPEHTPPPYNPEVEWGGFDQMSIMAMWEGDIIAEIYCFEKASRLGGWPWDEHVRVHRYYGGAPLGDAERELYNGFAILFGTIVILSLLITMCAR